jgi:hypothetical protein
VDLKLKPTFFSMPDDEAIEASRKLDALETLQEKAEFIFQKTGLFHLNSEASTREINGQVYRFGIDLDGWTDRIELGDFLIGKTWQWHYHSYRAELDRRLNTCGTHQEKLQLLQNITEEIDRRKAESEASVKKVRENSRSSQSSAPGVFDLPSTDQCFLWGWRKASLRGLVYEPTILDVLKSAPHEWEFMNGFVLYKIRSEWVPITISELSPQPEEVPEQLYEADTAYVKLLLIESSGIYEMLRQKYTKTQNDPNKSQIAGLIAYITDESRSNIHGLLSALGSPSNAGKLARILYKEANIVKAIKILEELSVDSSVLETELYKLRSKSKD